MRSRTFVLFLLLVVLATGVFAHHIEDYPGNLIQNGVFTGKIVLGERASTTDVIGAVDIATSLQTVSTSSTQIYHGVSINGDAKIINGGKLQIRKKPTSMLTEKDLKAFATKTVTTDKGATEYRQFLRMGSSGLQQITSNFVENDDNQLRDYMVITGDAPFFEWEEQFSSGFESERKDDGSLQDFEGKTIGLVGMNAGIVSASIDENGESLEITLMGGSIDDTLREGEEKTYTVGDETYEVMLVFVSDPNSGDVECKFSVNGELTKALEEGDTDEISGGLQIGVRDILVNAREGVASFYLGAHKIVLTDDTLFTESYDGTVEIDNKEINDGEVQIVGTFDEANNTLRIAWIKYRYTLDALDGATVFMPQDTLLRQVIKEPEGMISDFDVHYHGVVYQDTKNMSITQSGDDTYALSFFNSEGKPYTMPLLTNKDGVWKYGSEDDDLIFIEGTSIADTNIGVDDFVVLSNNRGTADADKSATHILRYTDYDEGSRTVEFESQSDKKKILVPLSGDGVGYLIPGAHTYKINVSDMDANEPNLSIDLDANGAYGNTVKVVAWGGIIVNLAQNVYLNDSANTTLTNANMSLIVGNGKTISGAADFNDGSGFVQMSATVLAKRFDTPTTDELLNWTISQDTGDEVDLSLTVEDYEGPLSTGTSDENIGFFLTELDDNDDYSLGLTDFGTYITYHNPSRHPGELTLNIPATQRYTEMYVSIGQVIHGAKPPTLTKINPLSLGLAVLDTDAPEVGSTPLIVVGGPCANSVAAQLLETQGECAAGFEPDRAIIKSFDVGETMAIVVAGYEGEDTLAASRMLARAGEYKLKEDSIVLDTSDPENPKVIDAN